MERELVGPLREESDKTRDDRERLAAADVSVMRESAVVTRLLD